MALAIVLATLGKVARQSGCDSMCETRERNVPWLHISFVMVEVRLDARLDATSRCGDASQLRASGPPWSLGVISAYAFAHSEIDLHLILQ